MVSNPYQKIRIEYHILQSFPVTCLNRDDVGAPKTAVVGGVTRARVSSQCWKRQVRLALQDFGVKLASRTKHVAPLFRAACEQAGASAEQAEACGTKIADLLSDDTLLFISDSEATSLAAYAAEVGFEADKLKDKELAKRAKKALTPATDALDIALFGRMVAKAADMNIEAAACFSHALSTHKVSNEIDFFTALDDQAEEPGAAHMGTLEFNSATYYRYISLDLGQLAASMEPDDIRTAIAAFTYALYQAVPAARQTTQSGASPWDFARVLVRRGQRLQVPFDAPVKAKGEGYAAPSIEALTTYLDKKERLSGSLFGKLGCYDWGLDETFSIDDLVQALQNHVQ
ncbi:type I-E CRISPR-associated protein Cas7/Cse4/CasC [Insolitispirillum peregrinum]|uniref:type I-E CRISPR-associated protein Cas7/Cse4/CasC n=1 Tax=Insolitispirillum peregrinum TaxID=80876 RepID=UPI0036231FE7